MDRHWNYRVVKDPGLEPEGIGSIRVSCVVYHEGEPAIYVERLPLTWYGPSGENDADFILEQQVAAIAMALKSPPLAFSDFPEFDRDQDIDPFQYPFVAPPVRESTYEL